MILVDTHAHLHFPEFDKDREQVFERAGHAGIRYLVNVGTDTETSKASLNLAEKRKEFFASAGFHPHEASKFNSGVLPVWEEIALKDKVVAIGEVGLDFFRKLSPPDVQEEVLRVACRLARAVKKPLILHVRDAFEEIFQILGKEFPGGGKGVFHCFSGNAKIMQIAVEMGFHISFSGMLTYKGNDELRKAAADAPKDRILLETDSPYLPPQSRRGKRNEPAFMIETAQCLAEVRNVSLEEIARQTTENANNLFGFRIEYV